MRTALITLALAAGLNASAAAADPVKLTGPEIKALFTGNTVHGQWAGKEYWSYFGADGWTTYLSKGGKPANGRWAASTTQYCSTWDPGGTSCYDIFRDGDAILWGVPSSGERYPSVLLTGDQIPQ